ncbi:synaptonemal complex central element protein 2 [Aquila chrysaetos chrysaetos]|uniref:synaptonemal complex central element protein 2 n=1 Tax=Aquila chrysaetos chrysaetos TaxID=223781 RepID=UPI0005D08813|nr:synaptonemal complex central element protein 2 [Aquila chrysaetos chrysaetos]
MTAAPHDPPGCLSLAAPRRGTSSLLNRPPPPTGRPPMGPDSTVSRRHRGSVSSAPGTALPAFSRAAFHWPPPSPRRAPIGRRRCPSPTETPPTVLSSAPRGSGTPLGLSVGPEQQYRSQAGPSPPSDPTEPGCAPVPGPRRPPAPRVCMSRKEHEGPELEAAAGDSPFVGLGRDEPPSEDPDRTEVLPTAPRPSTEAALDGQASRYFAALDASVGGLQQRTQQLIDRVNDSRKEDHTVMSSFRESLLLKVSGLAEQLEERLFHLYGLHNELIQERLQELAEVMERVGQAEAELRQVCRTVEAAYHDLCLQPET